MEILLYPAKVFDQNKWVPNSVLGNPFASRICCLMVLCQRLPALFRNRQSGMQPYILMNTLSVHTGQSWGSLVVPRTTWYPFPNCSILDVCQRLHGIQPRVPSNTLSTWTGQHWGSPAVLRPMWYPMFNWSNLDRVKENPPHAEKRQPMPQSYVQRNTPSPKVSNIGDPWQSRKAMWYPFPSGSDLEVSMLWLKNTSVGPDH